MNTGHPPLVPTTDYVRFFEKFPPKKKMECRKNAVFVFYAALFTFSID